MNLKTPIAEGERLLKMYAKRLEKLDIYTFDDLLYHIPFRYDDFSLISKISAVQPGETVTIQGAVTEFKNNYAKRVTLQKAKVEDETARIEVVWFNQPYLAKTIPVGSKVSLSGKIEHALGKPVIQSPEFEVIYENTMLIHTGRLVPVYPETRGLSSKWLRRQVRKMLNNYRHTITEYLPNSIIEKNKFYTLSDAIEKIHFPNDFQEALKAKERLSFDELFLMHLASLLRREEWRKNLKSISFSIKKHQSKIDEFIQSLSFELTRSQKKALEEILFDLSSNKPMNRLLEGDVGSGKTVVGAVAMYASRLNGFQSVLMAPTEILAQQHFKTISNLLSPLKVKVELVTGSKKLMANSISRIDKTKNKPSAISNKPFAFDILIGTHALLSEKIKFDKLGLVIIDEQQRFGVEQRAVIRSKGKNPHLLTMTATPIPRTVALTIYGDLDLSYLSEMPLGRKRVKTWLVPNKKREAAYQWIQKQIKETASQVFVICPFIEESETMQTVKAAKKEFETLQKDIFPNHKLGLLHGKMKGKEKDEVLEEFRDKKIDILVATPVVEVGIDIPNATIIIIEAAEKFGLSQLHQLRGRVGRGEKQSYCLLFTESDNIQTTQRLKAMETIHSGAELSELDLKLRGGGDMYGTLQHGRRRFKIASFSDFDLIKRVKEEAKNIFPELDTYPSLLEKLKDIAQKQVSPD